MSFILRRVDESLTSVNTYLGEEYTVICKSKSPKAFEECLKLNPCGNPQTAGKCVTYWGGYKYIHAKEHAYIMTSSGETFEGLTIPIISSPTKKSKSEKSNSEFYADDIYPEKYKSPDFTTENNYQLFHPLKKFSAIVLNNKKDRICFDEFNELIVLMDLKNRKQATFFKNIYTNFLKNQHGIIVYTIDGKCLSTIGWHGFYNQAYEKYIDLCDNIHIRNGLNANIDSYELITDLPHKKFPIYDKNGENIIQWALLILPH